MVDAAPVYVHPVIDLTKNLADGPERVLLHPNGLDALARFNH